MTRNGKRWALIAFAISLIAAMVTMVGVQSASAHTGDLSSTAVCQDDGNYLVTYKLQLKNVPSGQTGHVYWRVGTGTFDGTPTSNAGMTKVGDFTGNPLVTLGTKVVPGNSTKAPWAYAFSNWTPDNATNGSDGGDIALDGLCKQKIVKDAAVNLTVTPPTCSANGFATISGLTNAVEVGNLDETVGSHTAVFNAQSGHQFADGSTSKSINYTIAGKLTGDICATLVFPVAPTVTQDVCTGPGTSGGFTVTLASTPPGVTYSYNANTLVVTAVADDTHKFGDMPTGWVKIDSHHATYKVTRTSPGDCLVAQADASVTVTPPTCDADGSASYTATHATLVGALDVSPGDHVAQFNAVQGYTFIGGSALTKSISYTVQPKDVSQHCFVQPPDDHRSHATKPNCNHRYIITTNETRTWVWNGVAYVPGEWVVTSVVKTKVDLTEKCTIIKHVHVGMTKQDECNCFRDWVKFSHGPNVKVHVTHPTKLTWIAHATGRTVHRDNGKVVQYLLPKHLNGSHGWAKKQTYKVSTTNVACPCHKTHTCHHIRPGSPPHCPTELGRLNKLPCHV